MLEALAHNIKGEKMNVAEFTEVLQELYPAAKVIVDEDGHGGVDWGKPVKKDVDKNWAVYIEGMILPWEDGITKESAKKYAEAFSSNGVMAAAQQMNHSHKTRQRGVTIKRQRNDDAR